MFPQLASTLLDEEAFAVVLRFERKRTDRSRRPFLLLLLEFRLLFQDERRRRNILVKSVIKSLRLSIRETDVMGWYKNETVIGVIFSELHQENPGVNRIRERVNAALRALLKPEQIAAIAMSVHVYPHGDLGVPGFRAMTDSTPVTIGRAR
jgi:hypothetical protein